MRGGVIFGYYGAKEIVAWGDTIVANLLRRAKPMASK